MRAAALGLATSVFLSVPLRAEKPAADPDLAKGKEQVRNGELDTAIAPLTGVVRRRGAPPGREAEVADAYLHLGIADAGLGQMSPATSQFVQALKRDPAITPDPKTTSPAALEAFAVARRQAETEGVVSPSNAKRKGGAGKKILIAAGAVGVGVGGAVAAGGSGGYSAAPPQLPNPFIPIATSPYLELQGANPVPGSQITSSQSSP